MLFIVYTPTWASPTLKPILSFVFFYFLFFSRSLPLKIMSLSKSTHQTHCKPPTLTSGLQLHS